MEFSDAAARQRVLAGGIAGMPLGERFILLDTLESARLPGSLAPDMLLVDRRQIQALRERLAWAGFEINDDIKIEELEDGG